VLAEAFASVARCFSFLLTNIVDSGSFLGEFLFRFDNYLSRSRLSVARFVPTGFLFLYASTTLCAFCVTTVESDSSNSIAIAPTPTVGAPASLPPSHPEGRIADRQDELIVVDLRSTVFLHSLVRCTVLVRNPLAGSCFVTACRHCVFVLQAQQLRIHETIDSHFYVSCGSVPIIENCTRLLFAPHPDTGDTDHWTIQVNDFNWLKATPSTNWGTLPPDAHRTLEALQGPPFGC